MGHSEHSSKFEEAHARDEKPSGRFFCCYLLVCLNPARMDALTLGYAECGKGRRRLVISDSCHAVATSCEQRYDLHSYACVLLSVEAESGSHKFGRIGDSCGSPIARLKKRPLFATCIMGQGGRHCHSLQPVALVHMFDY